MGCVSKSFKIGNQYKFDTRSNTHSYTLSLIHIYIYMFKNFLPILCVLLFVFFSLPTEASAKIWINEFYSSGSDDWIELYNDAAEIVILDVYSLSLIHI